MKLTNSKIAKIFVLASALATILLPDAAFARSRASNIQFGASRGLTFYTSPELDSFNSRLGNSPRLTVDKEFGRALTLGASYEFLNPTESISWGFEASQWAETLRGKATTGEGDPRSEATLAFVRVWLTGGVRLWPWVGPIVVKRNTNIFGHSVVMNNARALGSGLFSYLRLTTGPLLWRHDYLISDSANQTSIDYVSRSIAWEGGLRWTLGWRLGKFCDVGLDVSASRSKALWGENVVGSYYLSGRDYSDQVATLGVDALARSAWRTSQTSVFVRFFYP